MSVTDKLIRAREKLASQQVAAVDNDRLYALVSHLPLTKTACRLARPGLAQHQAEFVKRATDKVESAPAPAGGLVNALTSFITNPTPAQSQAMSRGLLGLGLGAATGGAAGYFAGNDDEDSDTRRKRMLRYGLSGAALGGIGLGAGSYAASLIQGDDVTPTEDAYLRNNPGNVADSISETLGNHKATTGAVVGGLAGGAAGAYLPEDNLVKGGYRPAHKIIDEARTIAEKAFADASASHKASRTAADVYLKDLQASGASAPEIKAQNDLISNLKKQQNQVMKELYDRRSALAKLQTIVPARARAPWYKPWNSGVARAINDFDAQSRILKHPAFAPGVSGFHMTGTGGRLLGPLAKTVGSGVLGTAAGYGTGELVKWLTGMYGDQR